MKKAKYEELIRLILETKKAIDEINKESFRSNSTTECVASLTFGWNDVRLHISGYGPDSTVDVFDLPNTVDRGAWIERNENINGVTVFTMELNHE